MSDFDRRLNRVVRHARREGVFLTIAIAATLLGATHCAHEKAWRVTGEGLVTLQATYIATGKAIDAAHDKGLMTDAEYRKWAAFARYFAPTYDIAADRWLHGDDTATEHAAAVLAALSAELATWAAKGGVQ